MYLEECQTVYLNVYLQGQEWIYCCLCPLHIVLLSDEYQQTTHARWMVGWLVDWLNEV